MQKYIEANGKTEEAALASALALLGLGTGAPFLWVYLVVALRDSMVKDVLVLRRFLSRKWMRRVSET